MIEYVTKSQALYGSFHVKHPYTSRIFRLMSLASFPVTFYKLGLALVMLSDLAAFLSLWLVINTFCFYHLFCLSAAI